MQELCKKSWKYKKHHTKEAREKISASNKKLWNEERRKKQSLLKKGKSFTNGGSFKKGHTNGFAKGYTPWNKGTKGLIVHSKESILKMSLSKKGKHSSLKGKKRSPFSEEWKNRIKKSAAKRRGIPITLEARKKMSEAQKKMVQNGTHHLYKGGLTKIKDKIRKSIEYKDWRKSVFVRDRYVCQMCKKRGGKLEADHIKPFSLIMRENKILDVESAFVCKELWNIENGRTLCKECHKSTDSYLLNYKNSIYDQWKAFL